MRYLILAAIAAVNLIFSNAVFPNINIAGAAPDIIICSIVSVAILDGGMTGAWLGLACGLGMDLFSGVIGFYALPYFFTGAFVYFVRSNFHYVDRVFVPSLFALGAYLLRAGVNAVLAYMLDAQFSLSHIILRYFIPEAVLTGVFMLLVHFIMIKIFRQNYMKRKSDRDFKRLL